MDNCSENATRNISAGLVGDSKFYIASLASGIVMLIVFVCSIVLSPVVLWALWKSEQLKSSVYRMIAFVLLNEILIRIFGSPLIITSMLSGRWLYGDAGCLFYGFGMTCLGVTTSSLFTCVAVERYIIICRTELSHHLTKRMANKIGLACYIHGLAWAITPLFMVNGYVYETSRLSCTPDWSHRNIVFILGLVLVCFLIPLVISMYCYIKIYKVIRGHTTRTRFNSSIDTNVAFNTAITLGTFLIAWTPYTFIGLQNTLGAERNTDIPKEITLIPLVTAKTAGVLHPFIFGLNNRDIRTTVRSQLSKFRQLFYRQSRSDGTTRNIQYDKSHSDRENEVTHKNNIYRQIDDTSRDLDKITIIPSSLIISEV